jgi:hypothetical protein
MVKIRFRENPNVYAWRKYADFWSREQLETRVNTIATKWKPMDTSRFQNALPRYIFQNRLVNNPALPTGHTSIMIAIPVALTVQLIGVRCQNTERLKAQFSVEIRFEYTDRLLTIVVTGDIGNVGKVIDDIKVTFDRAANDHIAKLKQTPSCPETLMMTCLRGAVVDEIFGKNLDILESIAKRYSVRCKLKQLPADTYFTLSIWGTRSETIAAIRFVDAAVHAVKLKHLIQVGV